MIGNDEDRMYIIVYRWDIVATKKLLDYMQKCFSSLHKTTTEIGYKIYKKHGLNPIDYLKLSVRGLIKYF